MAEPLNLTLSKLGIYVYRYMLGKYKHRLSISLYSDVHETYIQFI